VLAEIGLPAVAEQIYVYLLEHPWEAESQLSQRIGVPLSDVSSNLAVLRTLGIAYHTDFGVQVVKPPTATQILLRQQETGLAELQSLVERSRVVASNFVSEYHLDMGSDENERIFGEKLILARVAQLAAETIDRMDTFAPGSNYPKEHIEASQIADLKMIEHGVKSRVIYVSESLKCPQLLEHFSWLTDRGIQVRTSRELPVRMIISDQRTAILPIDLSDGMNGILVVKDTGTIKALCALFEATWANSAPYGETVGRSEDVLDDRDITILRLLSEALTDKQIAARMGFKDRTAASAVETVRRKLGARNRFELGLIAAKEGWI